jgi:hypothetical protein
MSLRIRSPRYDSVRDGRPQHGSCEGCDSLYVIHLYVGIAKRRAAEEKGIVARPFTRTEEQPGVDGSAQRSDVDRR